MKKVLLVALMGALAVSCGNTETKKKEESSVTHNHEHVAPETPSNSTAKHVENGTIVLEGTDQMTFNLSEIKAKAGEKVTLTLKHVGKMPVTVMGHNFVLLKQGTDVAAFAAEALKAKDSDYVPAGSDAVIAHTKVIGGGEETTITFDAPEAGTYDFICSFPAHAAMMKGKFIVE
ncbi:Azurin [Capnocytophaga canis]|uniref:Azurin n=1 Tax=Capnocytophaga canis TaxID=1848903 RepID=A0A0B7ID04_9FLAO|nr:MULTISPECIES: azurin [Capnocytophaga]ATA73230.1 azurin [Capnocytophaga sp. H4358]ATA75368.1 azurin [Capnocytophaga sp. H2931]RIY38243.1 azurin [Capnocytophaga canis]CEN45931.1 Azurin [Capnocytophaga canis]CEN48599.1 Azurin [Capnocytophaga canis]